MVLAKENHAYSHLSSGVKYTISVRLRMAMNIGAQRMLPKQVTMSGKNKLFILDGFNMNWLLQVEIMLYVLKGALE